jgi:hypothetical protein
MSGPKVKPKTRKPTVLVPHPDDADDVRRAFDDARRDDLLSPEESDAYLRELLGEDKPAR